MSIGIIYIATGRQFIDEARLSAESVKTHMPDIPVTVFCDREFMCPFFDRVVRIERPRYGFIDKLLQIGLSPYANTLFLDTDTYVCGELSELFSLLDRFDIAAAHAPYRVLYRAKGVPDSFPEFNSGVILFKQSEMVRKFFAEWLTRYQRDLTRQHVWLHPLGRNNPSHVKGLNDQPSFRETLYESGLRVATLPSEYNCRFIFPGFVHNPVKILHGRSSDLRGIVEIINRSRLPRAYRMRWGKLKILPCTIPSRRLNDQFRWSVHQHGIRRTVGVAMRKLRNLQLKRLFRFPERPEPGV